MLWLCSMRLFSLHLPVYPPAYPSMKHFPSLKITNQTKRKVKSYILSPLLFVRDFACVNNLLQVNNI